MSSDQSPKLQDTDETRERRDSANFSGLNRKQRRRVAKTYKLFKDRSGEAWRIANKHMKSTPPGKDQHGHNH